MGNPIQQSPNEDTPNTSHDPDSQPSDNPRPEYTIDGNIHSLFTILVVAREHIWKPKPGQNDHENWEAIARIVNRDVLLGHWLWEQTEDIYSAERAEEDFEMLRKSNHSIYREWTKEDVDMEAVREVVLKFGMEEGVPVRERRFGRGISREEMDELLATLDLTFTVVRSVKYQTALTFPSSNFPLSIPDLSSGPLKMWDYEEDNYSGERPPICDGEFWNPINDKERDILVLAAKYIYNKEPNEQVKWEKVAQLVQTKMEAECRFDYPYTAEHAKSYYSDLEQRNHRCIRNWDGVEADDEKVLDARNFYGIMALGAMGLPTRGSQAE